MFFPALPRECAATSPVPRLWQERSAQRASFTAGAPRLRWYTGIANPIAAPKLDVAQILRPGRGLPLSRDHSRGAGADTAEGAPLVQFVAVPATLVLYVCATRVQCRKRAVGVSRLGRAS